MTRQRVTHEDLATPLQTTAVFGLPLWVGLMAANLAGFTERPQQDILLMLAPMVIVPLGLDMAFRTRLDDLPRWLMLWIAWLSPVGAMGAVFSTYLEEGAWGVLALGGLWLGQTALIALLGVVSFFRVRPLRVSESIVNIGLIYLVIGGAWFWAGRMGMTPFGFTEPIVSLTAVHFHFAGFTTAVFFGVFARTARRDSLFWQPYRFSMVFAAISVIVVAIGITVSPLLEFVAAVVLAAGLTVLAVSALMVAPWEDMDVVPRAALPLAMISLVASMFLAVVYAYGEYVGEDILPIPMMVATHGYLNTVGFGLLAMIAAARKIPEDPAEAPDVDHD